jgi:hypothetical protein
MELDPFAVKSFRLQSFSLSIRSRPDSILGKNEPYSFSCAPFSCLSSCAERQRNKCENARHSWERNECTEIKIRPLINFHIFTTLYSETSILGYGRFLLSTGDVVLWRGWRSQSAVVCKNWEESWRCSSLYGKLSLYTREIRDYLMTLLKVEMC